MHPIVSFLQRERRADLGAFVSNARNVKRNLVLAVQNPHPLVKPAREQYVPIHFERLLVAQTERAMFDLCFLGCH
jgi:hypothetical protein